MALTRLSLALFNPQVIFFLMLLTFFYSTRVWNIHLVKYFDKFLYLEVSYMNSLEVRIQKLDIKRIDIIFHGFFHSILQEILNGLCSQEEKKLYPYNGRKC